MDWNPKDPPRYGGLKLDGVPPFQHAIEFEFDPEVNVFIGPNATGKSTLLKLLSPEYQEFGKLPDEGDYSIERAGDNWLDYFLSNASSSDARAPRLTIPDTPEYYFRTGVNRGTVPVVYLPPVREVAPPYPEEFAADDAHPEHRYGAFFDDGAKIIQDTLEARTQWSTVVELAAAAEQARVNQGFLRWGVPRKQWTGGLWLDAYPFTTFDCNRVYYALQKLAADASRTGRAAAAVKNTTRFCLGNICPEVIQGDLESYPIKVLLDPDADEYDASYGDTTVRVNFSMAAKTRDSESPLYWGDLSTGTQGLFWWICYLALKLGEHYSFSDGEGAEDRSYRWQDQPAILLIDEIENHLHPTWQRRVIPALRKCFPRLQIFATTHSPFVVAGLKRGQVHRLYREKGVIKTDKLTEEEKERKLVGWTVEQILRKFMDVTDPTDEETATAAATLRWLQGRQPPPDVSAAVWVQECIQHLQDNHERDENETAALVWLAGRQQKEGDALGIINAVEWRAEVLGELRTMVSLDIEAGGPFAAQRERFTAQLRKLLAKDQPGSQDPDVEG